MSRGMWGGIFLQVNRNGVAFVNGKLYGVGVGPGDPELLTLKAARVIEACAVIAAPDTGGREQLALQIAAQHVRDKELLLCELPMTRDARVLEQCRQRAADLLCGRLERGEDVAFLTLGDPSVYATYSYLHRMVAARGYAVEIVPGVPSFCAAAAALGEPLCENEQPLHILPASYTGLPDALRADGTKVLMKLGKRRADTLALLERMDLLKQSAVVERCTMPDEQITRALSASDEGDGYFAVVVVKEDGTW